MPNPNVGLFSASGAHAQMICGDYTPSGTNSGEGFLGNNEAVYVIDSELIDLNKYRVAAHCLECDKIEDINNGYKRATNCTYKEALCPGEYFLFSQADQKTCYPCGTYESSLTYRDYTNFHKEIGNNWLSSATSCDYCLSGYYRSGAPCVPCPTTQNIPVESVTVVSVASWGGRWR